MSSNAIEVRRATGDDVGALTDLVDDLAAEPAEPAEPVAHGGTGQAGGPPPTGRDRLVAALRRPDLDLLVAWAGDRAVGVAVVRRGGLLSLTGPHAVHVEHLAVRSRWRRRGVARQLLLEVAAIADAAGCPEVTCATPAGHREANRYLARLGFAPAVTHRVTPTAVLRRQLARRGGPPSRGVVQQVIVRRRLERGRRGLAAAGPGGAVDCAGRLSPVD